MRERLRAVTAREDGISLIEMLVAIMILGIALAAFASSMVSSLQAVGRDHRLVVANALATEVIEELQGLPWEEAGFYEDEATSQLGGTTFEGEDLVLVSGTRDPDSIVPQPVRTEARDGIDYTVTTAITWVDDDADNDEDGDDETGDNDDYKRFVVQLEWSLRGRPHDLRVTALRSAETRERPLRADAPDTVPLGPEACNESEIELTATTLDPVASVTVSFNKRDGSTAEVNLVHAGDGQTWSRLIPTTCPLSYGGPFPDGPVLFTFQADDASGESYGEATEMVVFQRLIAISEVDVSGVKVLPDGRSKCAVTIQIDVDGGTVEDAVSVSWSPLGPEPHQLDVEDEATTATTSPAGATFTHTYPAGTQFGDGNGTEEETTMTVDVVRGYDSASPDGGATAEIVPIQRVTEDQGSC